jgi:hypothetical protein
MGAGWADDPASQARRPSARGECSRGSQRNLLRALDGLPMAGAAEGPAAEEHGTFVLHAVGAPTIDQPNSLLLNPNFLDRF